jgi:hypothetical protein
LVIFILFDGITDKAERLMPCIWHSQHNLRREGDKMIFFVIARHY